ncbi:MAG TPA: hypothetical protein DEH05_16755 [Propionibacteriaceae bacterium]|nr:hypothetical protein [Propionibacteriaceae bacterium]
MHARRVGLTVLFHGTTFEVDSEMLAPPMSIGVYFGESPAATSVASADILAFLIEALAFQGFDVQLL